MGAAWLAGVVKGAVGFAMPMIMLSILCVVMPPEMAVAGLILPTLVANGMQAVRQGMRAAVHTMRNFRVFLGCGLVALLLGAQLTSRVPDKALLLVIGGCIAFFSLAQLGGMRIALRRRRGVWDAAVGALAGGIGGLCAVWGPPTVLYLMALGTEKHAQIRIQGVVYGLGSLALVAAHGVSGVLNSDTLWFSLVLVVPAVIGMGIGARISDRMDQAIFRKLTLGVLVLAALNLIRQGMS